MSRETAAALESIGWWVASMVLVVGGPLLVQRWRASAKSRRVNRMLGRATVLAAVRTPSKPFIPAQRTGGERRA